MPRGTKISNAAAIAACDTVVDLLDVGITNANAKVRIYDGPQPDNVTDAPSTGNHATGAITGATQANPVVVTSNGHGLSNGDKIFISGVVGMTQLNEKQYLVANVTTNTFELQDESSTNIDGTGFTAYTSGGTWVRGNALLAELDCSNPAFGGAVDDNPGGKATASAISDDTSADATGEASWFRAVDRNVNAVIDGDAGPSGSGADMILDNRSIVATQTVKITLWTVTMPEWDPNI